MSHTAFWLWGEKPFGHYVAQVFVNSAVVFALGALVFGPVFKRALCWVRDQDAKLRDALDAGTPGGIGDIPDDYGIPAHVRMRRLEELNNKPEEEHRAD